MRNTSLNIASIAVSTLSITGIALSNQISLRVKIVSSVAISGVAASVCYFFPCCPQEKSSCA